MEAARLTATIDADSKDAEEGMKRFHGRIQDAATGFQGLLKTAGGFALGSGIIGGIQMIGSQIGDMVTSGAEANEVMAQTAAALKSTHDASGMTAPAIEALANKYMALTCVDDDVVQSSENILLSFTNVKRNAFEPATRAAMDLAARLGTDVPSAATIVGRALDNPAQAARSLRQAHISLTQAQQDQIKSMLEQGHTADAQKVILDALNQRYGGAAEASGKANGGVKILTAQFNNLKQGIGQAILTAIVPLAQQALPQAQHILESVAFVVSHGSQIWKEHQGILLPIVGLIGGALVAAFVGWTIAAGAAAVATLAATWPVLAIGAGIGGLIALLKLAYDHWTGFHDVVNHIPPILGAVKDGLGHVADFLGTVAGKVGDLIGRIGDLLGKLGQFRDSVNNIPGLGGLLSHVPGLASGGPTPAGPFVGAERGPELLLTPGVYTAPQGSMVINARDTQRLLAGSGGGMGSPTYNINVYPAKEQLTANDLQTIMRRHALLGTTSGGY